MKTSNIPIRIAEDEKIKLEAIAKRRGITLSELIRRGVSIIGGFDDDFSTQLGNLCSRMNLPESIIIHNIVTGWMAQKDAEKDVYPGCDELLMEFMFSSAGPLPSRILYENMRTNHISNLEKNKELLIRLRKENGTATQKEIEWLDNREKQLARMQREQEEAEKVTEEGRAGFIPGYQLQRVINEIKSRQSD